MRRRHKPVIAMPVLDATKNNKSWELKTNYLKALNYAGAQVVPVAMTDSNSKRRKVIDRADGVIFLGGKDVQPSLYGSEIDPYFKVTTDPGRDEFELEIMDVTFRRATPAFYICRGMQLLNVYLGGTLWRDLSLEGGYTENHRRKGNHLLAHDIHIRHKSLLHEILERDYVKVNSVHHQGIRRIAKKLKSTAHSDEGVIEAVEIRDYPFGVGVQFHPETLIGIRKWPMELFEAFVAACQ